MFAWKRLEWHMLWEWREKTIYNFSTSHRDRFEVQSFRLLAVWYPSPGFSWCIWKSSLWSKNRDWRQHTRLCVFVLSWCFAGLCVCRGTSVCLRAGCFWICGVTRGWLEEVRRLFPDLHLFFFLPTMKACLWVKLRGPVKSSQKLLLASAIQIILIQPWVRAACGGLAVSSLQTLTIVCFALM